MPLGFTMLCQLHGACQRLLLARDVLVHVRSPVVRQWGALSPETPFHASALLCKFLFFQAADRPLNGNSIREAPPATNERIWT